jgi:hypothetical protein
MPERKVYDYARGKYGVLEAIREAPMALADNPRNFEAVTAVLLGAFAGGLTAAFVLAAVLIR